MCRAEDKIQSGLLSFYQKRFPFRESMRILNLAAISDGWETEVYAFTAQYEEAAERKREDLILRIYPGDDAPQKSTREFNAMKRLHQGGFPVPKVLILELVNSPFGKPFVIMEKIDGRLMGDLFVESPDEKKQELLTLFCRMFVDLHTLDWKPFAPDLPISGPEDPSEVINHELSGWQAFSRNFQHTEFDPVFDWLKERSSDVRCKRLSVIHWDYHPWNILLKDNGEAFVIDWGGVNISDFRFDLAWTLLLTSTYGKPKMRETVLDEYERIAGDRVEQIEYFEVAATLRRLFSIVLSLRDGADKLGMRPGAEKAMLENVDHIRNVYAVLGNRTGITIPEIERLLSTLS